MVPSSSIRFELANGISGRDLENAKFLIYAHVCFLGVYVGRAEDPVKRWQIHVQDSQNENSPYHLDPFKDAIRRCGHESFKHYIVAVAKFEKAAKSKEAAAIAYYGKNLNKRAEALGEDRDFGFRPLEGQLTTSIVISKKSREGTTYGRQDGDRKTIEAEIYSEYGRKRVRSLENPHFPAGLNIECSRSSREQFNFGDVVRVNVALSEKDGRRYLVAAKTATFIPVKKN